VQTQRRTNAAMGKLIGNMEHLNCFKCDKDLRNKTYIAHNGVIRPICDLCFSAEWDVTIRASNIPDDWDCEDTQARINRKFLEGV